MIGVVRAADVRPFGLLKTGLAAKPQQLIGVDYRANGWIEFTLSSGESVLKREDEYVFERLDGEMS